VRDELGLDEQRLARPFRPRGRWRCRSRRARPCRWWLSRCFNSRCGSAARTLIALGWLGDLGARLGGAPKRRASIRIVVWGAVAMGSPRASACSSARSP